MSDSFETMFAKLRVEKRGGDIWDGRDVRNFIYKLEPVLARLARAGRIIEKQREALAAVDTFYVFFDSIVPPNSGNGARHALALVRTALALKLDEPT